jgi:hypothetical protein
VPDDITRFAEQPCPYCGKTLDAAGSPDGTRTTPPDDGDFLVCFGCAQPAVAVVGPFGVALREATAEELATFAVDHAHHAEKLRRFLARHPESPTAT